MQIVRPYIDDNKQVIFVEIENKLIHDIVNGAILALVVFGPLAVVSP